MIQPYLISDRDTFVFALVCICLLFMIVFRLDNFLAKPKTASRLGHTLNAEDGDRRLILIDPDGTQSMPRKRK
jgi:hypothetical protein